MTGKRTLTPEEKRLWQTITRHDKKLHAQAAEPEAIEKPKANHKKEETKKIVIKRRPPALPESSKHAIPVLGHYANIDRNTAEKLRRGHWPIDATLDLHGYTRDKAYAALLRFIAAHYNKGSRALLVITGKGIKPSPDEPARGILRESLPLWLAEDSLAPCILAFDVAKPKDGGSGAYYVLLRRKR